MVPSFEYWDITRMPSIGQLVYSNGVGYVKPKKVETKKECIKRISTEKMLASWKTYNDKTPTIIEIKQICKSVHRVGPMGIRNR